MTEQQITDAAARREPAGEPTATTRRQRRATSIGRIVAMRYAVIVAWVLEIVLFALLNPGTFLTLSNFTSIAGSQGALLVLALSLIPTLSVGEIDLSIASVMTISAITVGQLNGVEHWALAPALLVGMAAAVLAGLVNGVLTVYLGVQGIIVTLGMSTFLFGIAQLVSHSSTVAGVSPSLGTAMNQPIFGISATFYYALVLAIVLWYTFRHTPLGRRMLFLGRNREAARLSGVQVPRLRLLSFVAGAALAGLAGVMTVGVSGGLAASSLQTLLLPAFAAAFVGSTVFFPGQVNAFGTFVAVLFLQTGIVGLELRGLSDWVQNVFYGGALVVAVVGSRLLFLQAKRRSSTTV